MNEFKLAVDFVRRQSYRFTKPLRMQERCAKQNMYQPRAAPAVAALPTWFIWLKGGPTKR